MQAANKPLQNPLLTNPIPDLIRMIGVPVGIGTFFSTMYNVVDTYYAGLISREALAALSLSFPIYFIIVALAYGLSTGNTALMGNALGSGKRKEAERFAVQGIVYGAALSVLVTAVGILVSPALFTILGATDQYLAISLSYINPIFYATILFVTVQMLNAILNAIGNTKPGRNFLIFGFFLNLALDPWFIYGGFGVPAMGVMGIALATVLAQLLGCFYLGWEVWRSGMVTGMSLRRYLWPQITAVSQITRQGFPNIVDLNSVTLGFFVVTYFVSQFGQAAVAAFGAGARIEQVALLPLLGLEVATISLVAQNNGANLSQRVLDTVRLGVRYGLIIMLVGGALIAIFAAPLMDIFSDDPEVIAIGAVYVRIKALALLPSAYFFVYAASLKGVKRPVYALILSMSRMVIIPSITIFILVQFLGFGLETIWWMMAVATFIVGAVAYVMARRLLPEERKG
ncbi:MAG: MATE family efflux transporter [Chloroflexota bacterium]